MEVAQAPEPPASLGIALIVGERANPVGMAQGDALRQEATHREAEHVGAAPSDGIHDGDGVVGHVLRGVGGRTATDQARNGLCPATASVNRVEAPTSRWS